MARTQRKRKAETAKKKTPCESCKGFTVPARVVPDVARDKRGRFKKRAQSRLF